MDTSETYIKMCEKAEEIQKIWEPEECDYTAYDARSTCAMVSYERSDKFEFKVGCIGDSNGGVFGFRYREHKRLIIERNWYNRDNDIFESEYYWSIWLPRQDQLQEMVTVSQPQELLSLIYHWMGSEEFSNYVFTFDSMEQLWLAFVMKKYNKTWNGEDWIDG